MASAFSEFNQVAAPKAGCLMLRLIGKETVSLSGWRDQV
jgi:hypothetical protein